MCSHMMLLVPCTFSYPEYLLNALGTPEVEVAEMKDDQTLHTAAEHLSELPEFDSEVYLTWSSA